jgi:hypothetical protein
MANSALEIAKDALGSHKVDFSGVMHVKTYLLNSIGDVRPGEGKVL